MTNNVPTCVVFISKFTFLSKTMKKDFKGSKNQPEKG